MAESGAAGALGVVRGGRGGQGAAAAVARAGPAATLPQRPPLILPPRSSFESLFRGVVAEVSPGPLTLVSSFFAEEADLECRSFTQLLVGAMNSPVAAARRGVGPAMEQQQAKGNGRDDRSLGGGLARLEQNRPSSLAITQPQLFAVPPGLSPASLLDSPAFFSSPLSDFRISHQEALAQVTAQAAQSPFRKLGQAESPSSFFTAAATSLVQEPIQDIPTLQSNNTIPESAEVSQSNQISQPAAVVGKPAEDGYNWRKYGQKVVKGSEYPRSYYKCTHPNCTVKKKIERSVDGQITEVIYKGQHIHQKPPPNKRAREGGNLPSESYDTNGKLDHTITGEQGLQCLRGAPNETDDISSCAIIPQRDQDPGTSEQFSGSGERKEVAETKVDAMDELEPDHKRRTISISSEKATTEPRIIVQTRSEVDLLDDGYRWRKYGQKVVKGNPNPRSYYKCTYGGCNVRKHVERSSTDLKDVITTYEGKHNHDMPAARNSSHNIVNAPASSGM